MSNVETALKGASYQGFAAVREIGPVGMITLRAKPGVKGLSAAVKAATGAALPEKRQIVVQGDASVGWMGPDEYLLVLPIDNVPAALDALAKGLSGQHYLAVDVSDARAVFRIEGARADQVLRKLTPADMDALAPGELRRTRVAQIPAAFWHDGGTGDGGGFTLVCFRSVAGYAMGVLSHAATPGSEL